MRYIAGISLLLLIGIALGTSMLVYAAYVLLIVGWLTQYRTRRAAEALTATRTTTTAECKLGEEVAVQLQLRNSDRWSIPWVLVEDILPSKAIYGPPPSLEVDGSNMRMCTIASGGARVISYKLKTLRRGYFQLGPVIAETGDLLGLRRRFRKLTGSDYLLVLPKIIPLEGYDVASRRPIGEIKVSYRLQEDPTMVSGIRDYAPGDPIRRIHWRATARTGKLQCKEYQPTSVAGAMLVLDLHRDSNPDKHEPVRSDLAVTAAASICHTVLQLQQPFGLLSNGRDALDRVATTDRNIGQGSSGDEYASFESAKRKLGMAEESDRLRPVTLPSSRGPEHFFALHRTLARLERTSGIHLEDLLAESQNLLPRDSTVLVIVQEVTESAALALGLLARQGYSVAAIVNAYDDETFTKAVTRLLAQHIMVYHLFDEESIPQICKQLALKY